MLKKEQLQAALNDVDLSMLQYLVDTSRNIVVEHLPTMYNSLLDSINDYVVRDYVTEHLAEIAPKIIDRLHNEVPDYIQEL